MTCGSYVYQERKQTADVFDYSINAEGLESRHRPCLFSSARLLFPLCNPWLTNRFYLHRPPSRVAAFSAVMLCVSSKKRADRKGSNLAEDIFVSVDSHVPSVPIRQMHARALEILIRPAMDATNPGHQKKGHRKKSKIKV